MTTMALARREAWLVLRHPGVILGAVLCGLGYLVGYLGEEPLARDLRFDAGLVLPLLLIAWAGLITTNLTTLRARRDGTEELFESLPVSARARTAAHLASAVAVVPVAVVLMTAAYAVWMRAPGSVSSLPPPAWGLMILLVAGAGVSGVLVARWAPFVVAGPLAVIATVVLQSNFGHESQRWRWVHFAPGDVFGGRFDIGHYGWHLAYVFGLVLLAVALALARHGFTPRISAATLAVVALLGVSGWIQTRPLSEERVARRVDELEMLSRHQACEDRAGVRYCAYPEYQEWIRRWEEPVRGVLARVPDGVVDSGRRPLEVRQRSLPFVNLLPEVEAAVDPDRAWPADGMVHPGLEWRMGDHHLTLAFETASWVVGLPPAVDKSARPCTAAGQARLLLAVWLAGQSTPDAAKNLRQRAGRFTDEGALAMATPQPLDTLIDYQHEDQVSDSDYLAEVGAVGRGADVVAGAALLALPAPRVTAVMGANWERLIDPATPSRVVFDLLGVEPPAGTTGYLMASPGVGTACP